MLPSVSTDTAARTWARSSTNPKRDPVFLKSFLSVIHITHIYAGLLAILICFATRFLSMSERVTHSWTQHKRVEAPTDLASNTKTPKKGCSIFWWHLIARGFHSYNASRKENAGHNLFTVNFQVITCFLFDLSSLEDDPFTVHLWSVKCTVTTTYLHTRTPQLDLYPSVNGPSAHKSTALTVINKN